MLSWKKPDYFIVSSSKQLDKLCRHITKTLDNNQPICIDVETYGPMPRSGLDPYHGWLLGISIATDVDQGWYIPLAHERVHLDKYGLEHKTLHPLQLDKEVILSRLHNLFKDRGVFIMHNAKFDYKFLWKGGVKLNPSLWDTLVAHKLIAGNANVDSKLKSIIGEFVNIPASLIKTFEEVSYEKASLTPLHEMAVYAINDVIFTLYLYKGMKPIIDRHYKKLFYNAEMPLTPILAQMEMVGISIDVPYLMSIKPALERYRDRIRDWCALRWKANIGSSVQVGKIFTEELKFKGLKRTKKGAASTNKESLQGVMKETSGHLKSNSNVGEIYRLARRTLAYKEIDKALGTYIEKFPKIASEFYTASGISHRVIHTSFTQVRNSGRLSSSPNVQNIPRKTLVDIRRGFVARPGMSFVDADWKGQELRIAAASSNEPRMIEAFREDPINADLHRLTAKGIFGVNNPTEQQRFIGKTINFSILYGATEYSVSKTLNCSRDEAKVHINNFYTFYQGLKEWRDNEEEKISNVRYSETFFGRRRYLPDNVDPKMVFERWKYEGSVRQLINHIIQGTSADLLKFSMVELAKRFANERLNAYQITTTHDSIIVETTSPDRVAEIMKEVMEVKLKGILLPIDLEIKQSFSKKG